MIIIQLDAFACELGYWFGVLVSAAWARILSDRFLSLLEEELRVAQAEERRDQCDTKHDADSYHGGIEGSPVPGEYQIEGDSNPEEQPWRATSGGGKRDAGCFEHLSALQA
jgi:hypothetical protein